MRVPPRSRSGFGWGAVQGVVLLSAVFGMVPGRCGAAAGTGATTVLLRGELTLRDALDHGDTDALERLYADAAGAGSVRGRALAALIMAADGPMSGAERARLLQALRDPAPEVRAAAAWAVGKTRQRPLEREVLKLAAEDPAPRVRVQALRAVRGWTRLGHLYFLEQSLNSNWPAVQAETLANLGHMNYRELPPQIASRVAALAGADAQPQVRRSAFAALRSWGRLDGELLQEVVADPAAPDALRLYALELARSLPLSDGREELLLELLEAQSSLRLAWAAFRELTAGGQSSVAFDESLRRYLTRSGEYNAATEAMAAHLGRQGYRVDYRAGTWQIGRR